MSKSIGKHKWKVKSWTTIMLLFFLFLQLLPTTGLAERSRSDSLLKELKRSSDTVTIHLLLEISSLTMSSDLSKSIEYVQQGYDLAEKVGDKASFMAFMQIHSEILYEQGKYSKAEPQTDSLIEYYKKHKDPGHQVEAMLLKAAILAKMGSFDRAMTLLESVVKLSTEYGQSETLSGALIKLGNIHLRKAEYDDALERYHEAIESNKGKSGSQLVANAYRNAGITYKKKGDYEASLRYFYNALELNEKIGNPIRLAENWNSIGTLHAEIKRFDKATEAYKKALSKIEGQEPFKLRYNLLINIGQQYSLQNKLDSALLYYNRAVKESQELEGFLSRGLLLYNIGSAHYGLGQPREAIEIYKQALRADSIGSDPENDVRILFKLGMAHMDIDRLLEGEGYLLRAEYQAASLGLKKLRSLALKYLSEVYSKLNQTDKALFFYKEHILVRDSLFNEEKAAQIEALSIAQERSEAEHKLEMVEQKNNLKVLRKQRLIFGVGALALVAFLLFLFQRQRATFAKRQENVLRIQNNWLELQVLRNQFRPHFVFNALTSIQHFLLERDTDKSLTYITNFSSLMRDMLDYSQEQMITLKEEINFLRRYLDIERERNGQFEYEINSDSDLDTSDILIPNMLLQTSVENAVWHGIQKHPNGKIRVDFSRKNGWLTMEVSDNGPGLQAKETETRKSRGLDILAQRISTLNESSNHQIEWEIVGLQDNNNRSDGTTVRIRYKLE